MGNSQHVNDREFTPVTTQQPIPRYILYPLLKQHVCEVDGLTPDKVNVTGFKVQKVGLSVHVEINGRPYTGEMEADDVRSCLESELQTRLRIDKVKVLGWRLRDKDNPYLVARYTIVLPSEAGNE